jgi:hypothetical protein
MWPPQLMVPITGRHPPMPADACGGAARGRPPIFMRSPRPIIDRGIDHNRLPQFPAECGWFRCGRIDLWRVKSRDNSAAFAAPAFAIRLVRWLQTVLMEIPRLIAICLLDCPWAINSSSSNSRSVRCLNHRLTDAASACSSFNPSLIFKLR